MTTFSSDPQRVCHYRLFAEKCYPTSPTAAACRPNRASTAHPRHLQPMTPCPKCQRPPVSVSSPRCNYCGAAFKEGEKDWAATEAGNRIKHIEQNKNLARLRSLLTKAQRAMAIPLLHTGPVSGVISMLGEIAEAFAHDYSESNAQKGTHCHCGAIASQGVHLNWSYEVQTQKEFYAGHITTHSVRAFGWNQKTLASEFSTFHVACPTCAKNAFSSKAAFEKTVEVLPTHFRHRGASIYGHAAGS